MAAQPHVLVAEDNALVCGAMRVLFEETGRRVTTVGTVVEAVRVAREETVDLLLLDLGLADGSGLEVLAQLAAAGRMPAVSVALTGRDEPEIAQQCRDAGCADVLLKPVPIAELLRKAKGWLP